MSEKYPSYIPESELSPHDGSHTNVELPRILYEDTDSEVHPPLLSQAIDVEPPADRLKSPYPVIMAPGFLEDSPATRDQQSQLLEDEVMAMVEHGFRTISALHPRNNRIIQAPEGFHLGNPEKSFPDDAFQRSIDLLQLIEQKGLEKVNVVAHSQGGVDTLVAANIAPEKFKHIVLVNSAGLMGHDTLLGLASRFVRQLPKNSMKQQLDGTIAAMKNPLRALNEARGVTQSDILELIYRVQEEGVSTSLILNEDDPLFPADQILERISDHRYWMELKSGERINLPFRKISMVEGHHNTVHEQPDKYAKLFTEHLLESDHLEPDQVKD